MPNLGQAYYDGDNKAVLEDGTTVEKGNVMSDGTKFISELSGVGWKDTAYDAIDAVNQLLMEHGIQVAMFNDATDEIPLVLINKV